MNRSLSAIREDIRSLPADERDVLLRDLVADLDTETDDDAEAAWLEEAHRRLHEIERGSVTPIPAAEVFSRVRKLLAE